MEEPEQPGEGVLHSERPKLGSFRDEASSLTKPKYFMIFSTPSDFPTFVFI